MRDGVDPADGGRAGGEPGQSADRMENRLRIVGAGLDRQIAAAARRDQPIAIEPRQVDERRRSPVVRGAATGCLWTVGDADAEQVRKHLLLFGDPNQLGDFLAGLFCLARETVQRHRELDDAEFHGNPAVNFLNLLGSHRPYVSFPMKVCRVLIVLCQAHPLCGDS